VPGRARGAWRSCAPTVASFLAHGATDADLEIRMALCARSWFGLRDTETAIPNCELTAILNQQSQAGPSRLGASAHFLGTGTPVLLLSFVRVSAVRVSAWDVPISGAIPACAAPQNMVGLQAGRAYRKGELALIPRRYSLLAFSDGN
jgi:hypothetical protein